MALGAFRERGRVCPLRGRGGVVRCLAGAPLRRGWNQTTARASAFHLHVSRSRPPIRADRGVRASYQIRELRRCTSIAEGSHGGTENNGENGGTGLKFSGSSALLRFSV